MIKTILACFLAIACTPVSWPQSRITSKPVARVAPTTLPPYDRLELLASIAVGGSSPYLIMEVHERGVDFKADQGFLDAILAWHASTSLIGVIEDQRPRIRHTPSANRQKAYEILVSLRTSSRASAAKAKYQGLVDLSSNSSEQAASPKYQDAIALAPESPALHLAFAGHLLIGKDYSAAEVEARRSIRLWPGNADAHWILATALVGQDRSDAAVFEAYQALSIYRDHKEALIVLGMALRRANQFKEAIPVLRQAIFRTPEMPLLHKDLGIALFNTGNIEAAITEYVTFLQAAPNDADGHYQLGVAFRAQGHKDDALAQFRECARLDPSQLLCVAAADPSYATRRPDSSAGQQPDDGSVDRNTYTNRFFGFSFRFPDNWTVLSADDARAAARLGAGMMSGGDPTIEDAQQAAAAHAYPLLFVMPRGQGATSRSIQIHALDSQIMRPEVVSAREFLESSARLYRRLHSPLQPAGTPVEMLVDGRQLWRLDLMMYVDNNAHYLSEIVTIQDGFILMFVVSSPDKAGLDDLGQYMQSLHFFPVSK